MPALQPAMTPPAPFIGSAEGPDTRGRVRFHAPTMHRFPECGKCMLVALSMRKAHGRWLHHEGAKFAKVGEDGGWGMGMGDGRWLHHEGAKFAKVGENGGWGMGDGRWKMVAPRRREVREVGMEETADGGWSGDSRISDFQLLSVSQMEPGMSATAGNPVSAPGIPSAGSGTRASLPRGQGNDEELSQRGAESGTADDARVPGQVDPGRQGEGVPGQAWLRQAKRRPHEALRRMRIPGLVLGYHGCDRDVAEAILGGRGEVRSSTHV